MRLVISRNQQAMKGMLGGHKGVQFTLAYRLELTSEETELVRTYKLEEYPLTFRSFQGQQAADDTVANMVGGRSQTLTDVTTLIRNETIIKDACDQLPQLFDVVRTFGGDEVVEYPRQATSEVA
jgi:hypothetical protein